MAGEERKDTPDPPCKAVGDPMDSMVNGNHPLYQDHAQLARYPGGSRRVRAVRSRESGLCQSVAGRLGRSEKWG